MGGAHGFGVVETIADEEDFVSGALGGADFIGLLFRGEAGVASDAGAENFWDGGIAGKDFHAVAAG